MNATHTNNDSHAKTAPTDFGGRDNLTTVETPATLRRPNPNSDGEIPTGWPPNKGAAKKRLTRTLAAAAALAVALAAGAYYYWFVLPFQDTDDAFIEGYVIPIAPKVPGYVAQLLIKDNQWVKKGDVLLQIDPRDYETSVAQARADLTAARSQLDQSQAQVTVSEAKVAQAQSAVVAAEAENNQAAADLKRYESVDKNAVSRSAFDAAQSRTQTTQANLQAARSQVQEAESEVTLCQAGVETASAAVQQAQARLHQAELNLSYTKVVAPEDGRVTRRAVEEGAYVQPGQALMAVVPHQYWVIANFKETQLTHMRPGQPVTIRVDAYPQFKLKGHVDSIQSGSGARFSLFPPENATGNYIKVVQRVPVKIVFDDTIPVQLALGPGMSVDPKVRVK
jgi:membrane fusion protein (multidrug efflux system)